MVFLLVQPTVSQFLMQTSPFPLFISPTVFVFSPVTAAVGLQQAESEVLVYVASQTVME